MPRVPISPSSKPVYTSRAGLRIPIHPTKATYPSPRSGLTGSDAARDPATAFKPKSEAAEFRQAIRIDIGGLEMRAQEGQASRFEAARKFCELQYSLVASPTGSVEDKLAALADIAAAVNSLDVRFPGVFAAAKDLVVNAREALTISDEIENLKMHFEAADLETATWLLKEHCVAVASDIPHGPFKDYLRERLVNCWIAVQATHSDEHVRDLLAKHLSNHRSTGGGEAGSSRASASANDIASLRAAEATKVTLPPLRIHAASGAPSRTGSGERSQVSQQLPTNALNIAPSLMKIVALSNKVDKLLDELSMLGAPDLSHRLLMGEVADLIDEIAHGGNAVVRPLLFATLGHGLGALRFSHKDSEMRLQVERVLGYCFDPSGDMSAFTGERRLQKRAEFLLTEAAGMAPGLGKCRDDFALKLVDAIRRETGEDSELMLYLLGALDELPGIDQLKHTVHRRLAEGSD